MGREEFAHRSRYVAGAAGGVSNIRGHRHAESGKEPATHRGRPGHADGQLSPALLASGRGRSRVDQRSVARSDCSAKTSCSSRIWPASSDWCSGASASERRPRVRLRRAMRFALRYHGWEFDASGQCTHQPMKRSSMSDARLSPKTKITASKCARKPGWSGRIWARRPRRIAGLGAVLLTNGFAQIVFAEIPCNWFQCQENSIDPIHFEWTHNNWTERQQDNQS